MMQPDKVAALVAPYLTGVPHRIVRAATYRFHGLIAEQWRQGRVFLAGDAAHQTPPIFGQGMCHGLRDITNLAWKLELVLSDRAPQALLDSYQTERDPHVRAVISAAVAAGRHICMLDPDQAAARDTQMREAAKGASHGTPLHSSPPSRKASSPPAPPARANASFSPAWTASFSTTSLAAAGASSPATPSTPPPKSPSCPPTAQSPTGSPPETRKPSLSAPTIMSSAPAHPSTF